MSKKARKEAVTKWYERQHRGKAVLSVSHINFGYVIGYAAPGCLIVAVPWMTAEPLVREWDRDNPLKIFHTFDPALRAGDWCISAYVRREGCGEPVAISIPKVTAA
jgi:hypothetical protein